MIHRADHKDNFTRLTNSVIRSGDLSDSAFRLLIYMLSCSDDWNFSLKGLAYQLNWPERKVSRLVNELKKKGHIVQHINFDENGKFLPSTWDVYEDAADGIRHSRKASTTQSVSHAKRESRKASPTQSVKRATIRTNNNKELTNIKKEQCGKKMHALGKYQNVFLTDAEQEELCNQKGFEQTSEYIERLSDYLHDHPGKNYKSHKSTIAKWINEDEGRVAN
jgi:hypothetical protein